MRLSWSAIPRLSLAVCARFALTGSEIMMDSWGGLRSTVLVVDGASERAAAKIGLAVTTASSTSSSATPPSKCRGGRVIGLAQAAQPRNALAGLGAARAAVSGSRRAVAGTARAAPPPGPAGGSDHDRQYGGAGHREKSAGDRLDCADGERCPGCVGGPVADQPGHYGGYHISERWDRDDPVDGAGPDGAGTGNRPGD